MKLLQRNEGAPYWLPWIYSALFCIGAYFNNVEYYGRFEDFWMTGGWLLIVTAVAGRQLFGKRKPIQVVVTREKKTRVVLLVTVVTVLAVQYYATAGIPILSSNPDAARMEFMQGTLGFRILGSFVPFMVLYITAWVTSAQFRWRNSAMLVLLLPLQIFVGGKATLVGLITFMYLGFLISNKKPSLKVSLIGMGAVALGSLILFRVIMGLDSYTDAVQAVFTRITETSEFGLFITVNNLGSQIDNLAPVQFLLDVYEKYFGVGGSGFTPSLGRQITAQYYGGGVFDYIWELTISIFGDFYILAGWFGVLISYLVGWAAFAFFWDRYKRAKQLYVRCFYVYLWFKTMQLVFIGSIAAQIVVMIAPFVVFWSIGYMILWSGMSRRRVVHSPILLDH